jgi:hypothetical protein
MDHAQPFEAWLNFSRDVVNQRKGGQMRQSRWTATCMAALVAMAGCAKGADEAGAEPRLGGRAALQVQYVELLVVNDYSRFAALGIDTEQDTGDLINLVNGYLANSANLQGTTVQVILVGQRTLVTQASDLTYVVNGRGEIHNADALATFADYQNDPSQLLPAHDLAMLLTRRSSDDGSLERAYLGQICNPAASAAVVHTGYSLAFDASNIAHALGHNLGMCHDPPAIRASGNPGCPTLPSIYSSSGACSNFIMSESRDPTAANDRFSPCSSNDLTDFVTNRAPVPNCLVRPVVIR